MKVTWDDIGRATEAREYVINGASVNVALKDIEIWQEKPDAVFNATVYKPTGIYMLGSHEE